MAWRRLNRARRSWRSHLVIGSYGTIDWSLMFAKYLALVDLGAEQDYP